MKKNEAKTAKNPEKKAVKKKLIAAIVSVVLVLAILGAVLGIRACQNKKPPTLEALRPRVEALVEASREINAILFGEGLPTYPRVMWRTHRPFYVTEEGGVFTVSATATDDRLYYYEFNDPDVGDIVAYQYSVTRQDGEGVYYVDIETGDRIPASQRGLYRYAEKTQTPGAADYHEEGSEDYYYKLPDYVEAEVEYYYTSSDDEHYDYVREDCPYQTTDSIKEKAETVYASTYLAAIYEAMFTGVTVTGGEAGTLTARYIDYADPDEGGSHLMKSNTWNPLPVDRVYLYDTMRMVKPSNSRYVNVEIDTYRPGDEGNIVTVRVSLAYERGNWYLDSPTY